MNYADCLQQWYAVHVRSRHEFKVHKRLLEVGVEVFLPTVQKSQRWKDRRKLIEFPLFMNYIFTYICNNAKDIRRVLDTKGVVRLLGISLGGTEPVPQDQIESLKMLVENKALLDPYPYFKEGQRVRIKKGPFRGVEGMLIKKAGNHILVVSIELLQQAVSLKINASDIDTI